MNIQAVTLTTLDHALAYAARGWPILPLQPRGKAPLGALVPHGVKDATTDAATVRAWWAARPDANIGIATGGRFFVLDVDPRHGGEESLADLVAQHGDLPATVECLTGGGGRHLYFAWPAGAQRLAGKLGPGLDLKGAGGYVVAPPSVHPNGRSYTWEVGGHPDDVPIAPAPRWLLDLAGPAGAAQPDGSIVAGERNATLTSLAGSMRRRGMTPEAIEAALLAENAARCEPPLDGAEVRRIAHSVARYDPPAEAAPARDLLSDMGNAYRFVAQHKRDARYCPALGWLVWDGKRWARDDNGAVMRMAKQTALTLYDDAKKELRAATAALTLAQEAAATGAPVAKRAAEQMAAAYKAALARLAWADKSQRRAMLESMVNLAQSELDVLVTVGELDADPFLLNAKNGTIDLRTGQLREHRREDLITKLAPVNFDPTATHPVFDRFLSMATGGDEDLAAFLQRYAGYSLSGNTGEEQVALVLGPAGSGKSTLVEALLATMGDYAMKAPFETFLERSQANPGGARPDLVRFPGVRLIAAVETKAETTLDAVLLKELTGGDTVTARDLYRGYFSFKPQCKILLASNVAPKVSDLDSGVWRRLRRLPFEHAIPEEGRDPEVKAALTDPETGGPAILAWAVQGCLAWQRHGLGKCAIVQQRTAELRASFDPLAGFFDDCCIFGRDYRTDAQLLRAAYEEWATAYGVRPISNAEWGGRLRARGCEDRRESRGGVRATWWHRVGLLTAEDPDEGPPARTATTNPVFGQTVLNENPASVKEIKPKRPFVLAVLAADDVATAEDPPSPGIGDLVHLLDGDGVIQNAEPWAIGDIVTGPDGQEYALFEETTAGWPLERCERAAPARGP